MFYHPFLPYQKRKKKRFNRILSRLRQSKRKNEIEDKILDLGIALEMALLDDNASQQQLSLSFRLRGSWFISSDEVERSKIYKTLGEIYRYRSQVARNGILCRGDVEKINKIRNSYQEYSLLAERIIKKHINFITFPKIGHTRNS